MRGNERVICEDAERWWRVNQNIVVTINNSIVYARATLRIERVTQQEFTPNLPRPFHTAFLPNSSFGKVYHRMLLISANRELFTFYWIEAVNWLRVTNNNVSQNGSVII